jgi:hypothetical protein
LSIVSRHGFALVNPIKRCTAVNGLILIEKHAFTPDNAALHSVCPARGLERRVKCILGEYLQHT